MPLGTAFTLQGSNPIGNQTSTPAFSVNNTFGSTGRYTNDPSKISAPTPQVAALQKAASPSFTLPSMTPSYTAPSIKSVTTTYHPPAQNSGLISDTQNKLQGLQGQLTSAENAGYSGSDQIQHDSSGNVIPKTNETQAQNAPATDPNSFAGLLDALRKKAASGGMAVDLANQNLQGLKNQVGQQSADIVGTGADLAFKTGEEGALQSLAATKEAAAQSAVTNALTANQQGITGLASAASLAQPVTQYGALTNPQTGQAISGGGTGTLPADAQNVINTYAEQVKNGSMTRADAESRLAAYGVNGINALTQALGSNFNTNASNASAGTTATGQQIQTAANSTNQALDTLVSNFNALPGVTTGGIPLTNSIAQWIEKNLGNQALSAYKTNLADARSQLIGVLNSSGGTPTGNEATANEYLPDNMTKEQFDKNVGTQANPGIVRQLIAQKVGSFTNSGNQTGSQNGSNSGGSSGWASLGD